MNKRKSNASVFSSGRVLSAFKKEIRVIEHRLSDMVFLDKQQGKCHIIDIAVSGDAHIEENENERLEKYQD